MTAATDYRITNQREAIGFLLAMVVGAAVGAFLAWITCSLTTRSG